MQEQAFPNKAVLIIGDDPDYCELLGEAVRQHDDTHETNIVHDMESALIFLKAAQTSPNLKLPHLILLNLEPENSRKFIRRLRLGGNSRSASVPVAMMIASDDPRDIAACQECGANGYVVKPDTFDELVGLVADICRHGLGPQQCFQSSPFTDSQER